MSTKAGPISAGRLKSFIERIERLETERKAIGGDIKDVYSEAKGVGYDVKTMRKIVSLRAMDAADRAEAETLLDTYCHALGMVYVSADYGAYPTEEELEARAERIVREVDRCMYLGGPGQLPSIRAIQDHLGCSTGKASKIRGLVQNRISREIAKKREMKSAAEEEADIGNHDDDLDLVLGEVQPEDGDDGITESCGGVESRHAGGISGEVTTGDKPGGRPANASTPRVDRGETPAGVAPGPHDTHDDPGPIPSFLYRRTAQGRNV